MRTRIFLSILAMDRQTPTVAELVHRAAEAADPAGRDPSVARLQVQLEDDDESVTAVENLEERLALAAEGANYNADDPMWPSRQRSCSTSREGAGNPITTGTRMS
jgi:hypothetical protein